jgi:hypothetical protein
MRLTMHILRNRASYFVLGFSALLAGCDSTASISLDGGADLDSGAESGGEAGVPIDGSIDLDPSCNSEAQDAEISEDAGSGYCPEYPIPWPTPNVDIDPKDGGADAGATDASIDAAEIDGAVPTDAGEPLPTLTGNTLKPTIATGFTEAAARTELATLDSNARMFWNQETDTLSSVMLKVPLPGCISGTTVVEQVIPLLNAYPTLFQVDTEWQPSSFPIMCEDVEEFQCMTNGGGIICNGKSENLMRNFIANHPFNKDILSYGLARLNGVVTLVAVSGLYLPRLADEAKTNLDQTMTGCNSLTLSQAKSAVRARQFLVDVRDIASGAVLGHYSYKPKTNDSYVLGPEMWTWVAVNGEVVLSATRDLTLTINPCNYVESLLTSDARCSDFSGDGFTIGFVIKLDVHTGEIMNIQKGTRPNCTM